MAAAERRAPCPHDRKNYPLSPGREATPRDEWTLTGFTAFGQIQPEEFVAMSRICYITGKRPVKGNRILRRGQTKKSGGIGTHIIKRSPRRFRPNLQRIRVLLPSGQVRRLWVSVKALKAGKIAKAV